MTISNKHIELIEGYFEGSLSDNERLLVNDLMNSDHQFAAKFNEEKSIYELVESKGDLELFSSIEAAGKNYNSTRRIKKTIYWTAGSIVVLLTGLILTYSFSHKNSITQEQGAKKKSSNSNDSNEVLFQNQNEESENVKDPNLVGENRSSSLNSKHDPKTNEERLVDVDSINASDTLSTIIDQNKSTETADDSNSKESNIDPCDGKEIVAKFNSINSCSDSATGVIYLSGSIKGGKEPYSYLLNGKEQNTSRIEGVKAGKYSIQVTDVNGCESEKNEVLVSSKVCPKVIDYKLSPYYDEKMVYPLGNNEEGRVQIYNKDGKTILDKIVSKGEYWDCTINGVVVSAGSYSYTLQKTNGKLVTGFISIVP